jgi:hypothetical protein
MTSLPPPEYAASETEEPLNFDVKALSPTEKKELFETSSIGSTETDATATIAPTSFHITKSLLINSRGIGILRLPLPTSELEINICTPEGSIAYISTREKRSSGNAVLSSPDRGDLVASSYFFGPGRDPVITLLNCPDGKGEVKVSGRWTSRAQTFFLSAVPVTFEWTYRREKDAIGNGKSLTLLVLEIPGKKKGDEPKRIAQLVRGKEHRTPDSKSCSAGNGGELMIDELAVKSMGISEELIVSTCMMMLKKEIDRRRAIQFAMIAAIVSGGS